MAFYFVFPSACFGGEGVGVVETGLETFEKEFDCNTSGIMQYSCGSKQCEEECLTIIFIKQLLQSLASFGLS